MLRYFRINDPYRLVAVFILMLLVLLPVLLDPPGVTRPELKSMIVGEKLNEGGRMYVAVMDNTAPLAAWFHEMIDSLFGRSILARHIIAFVIIFLQCAYLGIIFITKKVFNENTFIPSLLFAILFFFSFDTLTLSDELLGSIFLLFALSTLFEEIEFRTQRDETTFNLGFFLSIASLFYLPFLIFLFCVLVILFLFARTNARKILLIIFGFLLPHLLVLSIGYLNDTASRIWHQFYLSNLSFNNEMLMSPKGILILGAVPAFYFVISIVMLNRLARFSKYQAQLLQSIFLWIGFCFIFFLFCRDLRPQTMIVLIPGLTFLLTHFLLLIRRKKFAEMNTWILLLGVIATSYLGQNGVLRGVSYERVIVPETSGSTQNRKVLVLGNQPELYLSNRIATPFLNWKLASEVFETPHYVESVTAVFHAFKLDPPDLIIDQNDFMKPFLDRIPDLKNQYVRKGIVYERITP